MIKLTNINKLYLGEPLLTDVTWHMAPGEKIGLIGANGTGKTTQLRIICGIEEQDSGELYIAPAIKIGYLSQEPIVDPEKTLNEEMYDTFKELLNAEKEIKQIQTNISTLEPGKSLEEALKHLTQLQEFFDHKEGYLIDTKIGQVISGLGFSEEDRFKTIKTYSGGWQMRISIAKLLLESPDLLLLDEPTNHLDIKTIEWLENYLATYKGAYIIVSHDRHFLDKTVERILEMEGSKVNLYWGNYSKYLEQKEIDYQTQLATYKTQQEKIARDKEFIEKFRASAARSSQAKSRERQLEKLELVAPPPKHKTFKFHFPLKIKSGNDVIKVLHLHKAYDDKKIFEELNFEVSLGDKIALIGCNGSGKTTLLRMIMSLDKNYTGKIKMGTLVKPMYFNQHEARSLSGSRTVFEELHDSAPSYTNEQIRTILGRFGITGDNVFKTLNDLSGGEKARLALAKILMSGANLLLFDEPTNHLDIPAKEALEEAISSFEGTVIAVSHDRKFIDNFANKILEIDNNNIKTYPGNYTYYKYKKEKEIQVFNSQTEQTERLEKDSIKEKEPKHAEIITKKLSPKTIEKQLIKLEKEIIAVEEQIGCLESELSDPEFYQADPEAFMEKSNELDELKLKLESLNNDWYSLTEYAN